MRFGALVWGLLLCCLVPVSSRAQEQTLSGAVHIKVVDSNGRDLGRAEVATFTQLPSGADFGSRFYENTANVIPYGKYELAVRATGFIGAKRVVQVFQPVVWTVVALEYSIEGREFTAPTQLSGRVINLDSKQNPVYLRLSGVYNDLVMDTRADSSSGDFTFTGLIPDGKYILIVSGPKGVLETREVDFPNPKAMVIDLGAPKNCGH
jgi:hypothetical protein